MKDKSITEQPNAATYFNAITNNLGKDLDKIKRRTRIKRAVAIALIVAGISGIVYSILRLLN